MDKKFCDNCDREIKKKEDRVYCKLTSEILNGEVKIETCGNVDCLKDRIDDVFIQARKFNKDMGFKEERV